MLFVFHGFCRFPSCWIPLESSWELCRSDWPCQSGTRWWWRFSWWAQGHFGHPRMLQICSCCAWYFSDTDFASAFDSSILRTGGCPFHASLQLASSAHTLQDVVYSAVSSSTWISVLLLGLSLLRMNWDWSLSVSEFGCTSSRSAHRNDIP